MANKRPMVVGDYDAYRGDRDNVQNRTTNQGQRDPNGPMPGQDNMVRCGVCNREYREHAIRYKVRGGTPAWWCVNKDCSGRDIGDGGDIQYI